MKDTACPLRVPVLSEPTSGLDGHAAAVVMRVTRSVANMQRTICCTIHQVRLCALLPLLQPHSSCIGELHVCLIYMWCMVLLPSCAPRFPASFSLAICVRSLQPSAEIFFNFDALVLLQTGGKMMYFGSLGEAADSNWPRIGSSRQGSWRGTCSCTCSALHAARCHLQATSRLISLPTSQQRACGPSRFVPAQQWESHQCGSWLGVAAEVQLLKPLVCCYC